MISGIAVTYHWHDSDALELSVTCWNGRFGGQSNVYVGQGELVTIGNALAGFPASREDVREVTLGAFGDKFAGGGVKINLYCDDLAGHARCNVSMESDPQHKNDQIESVLLSARFEPAALDTFIAELNLLSNSLDGTATLKF